jgi:hypothetical protein
MQRYKLSYSHCNGLEAARHAVGRSTGCRIRSSFICRVREVSHVVELCAEARNAYRVAALFSPREQPARHVLRERSCRPCLAGVLSRGTSRSLTTLTLANAFARRPLRWMHGHVLLWEEGLLAHRTPLPETLATLHETLA